MRRGLAEESTGSDAKHGEVQLAGPAAPSSNSAGVSQGASEALCGGEAALVTLGPEDVKGATFAARRFERDPTPAGLDELLDD